MSFADQVQVELADGWMIESDSEEFQSGDYVTIRNPSGRQYARWEASAWGERPAEVMGRIMIAAAGYRPAEGYVGLNWESNGRWHTEDGETVVRLADGWALRGGVYKPGSAGIEYVRLTRPDGSEYGYWDQDEWKCDPELVMGAILNSAAGVRFMDEAEDQDDIWAND